MANPSGVFQPTGYHGLLHALRINFEEVNLATSDEVQVVKRINLDLFRALEGHACNLLRLLEEDAGRAQVREVVEVRRYSRLLLIPTFLVTTFPKPCNAKFA
eukprot:CAMPEP_0179139340 /NCGR_PEP_ID=MMETSP0796-20121207/66642_1 /TAXON_ID=73915 /ORGANISM="Pyrodinium bahamense, Strain pbaha01" /LENGTH=101 /DNA_ID=CAMNT_0020838773 /DNA_START=466 /DNA_END=769 /DNA_ORIENTATION=-